MAVRDVEEYKVTQDAFLKDFQCLQDKCPDTCCHGWDMQLDIITKAIYENTKQGLENVVSSTDSNYIFKRNEDDDCSMLESGKCGIHKVHGPSFLSDACYFFPRIMFKLGDSYYASAGFSCPETARLILFSDDPFRRMVTNYKRIPYVLKDYSRESITIDLVEKIHNYFLDKFESLETGKNLMKLLMISRSLSHLPKQKWYASLEYIDKVALGLLPEKVTNKNNLYFLVQSLVIIVKSCRKKPNKRLTSVLNSFEKYFKCKIDWESTDIILEDENQDSASMYCSLDSITNPYKSEFINHIMARWLMLEMKSFFYPFSGNGKTVLAKTQILIVKYCLNKMLLDVFLNTSEDLETDTVMVIQSVAKFMDHLADDNLVMKLFESYSWNEDAKLFGMVSNICVRMQLA